MPVGFALVISSSIALELFSDATLVATICPYSKTTIYKANTII